MRNTYKKTMPKTAKKPTRSKLIKKLDIVFSKYIRLSNADSRGMCTCVTCGKQAYFEKDQIDAGHFMSRRYMSVRYDERNVHPQCRYCNRMLAGNIYKYSLFLGSELANDLYLKSKETVKFSSQELEEMIDEYTTKLKTFL